MYRHGLIGIATATLVHMFVYGTSFETNGIRSQIMIDDLFMLPAERMYVRKLWLLFFAPSQQLHIGNSFHLCVTWYVRSVSI